MRAFVISILVSLVVAAGAAQYLLVMMPEGRAYQNFAASGARVGDPGSNLVGQNWRGS